MREIPESLVQQCRQKLIDTKTEILNRVRDSRQDIVALDKGGDEADQTVRLLAERDFLTHQGRLRQRLVDVERALSRIDGGSYGICEETEELIEPERLLAVPWTRFSIEGAELREAVSKLYAR